MCSRKIGRGMSSIYMVEYINLFERWVCLRFIEDVNFAGAIRPEEDTMSAGCWFCIAGLVGGIWAVVLGFTATINIVVFVSGSPTPFQEENQERQNYYRLVNDRTLEQGASSKSIRHLI